MSYAGKILRIDLTNRKIENEPTSSYVQQYIGGRGVNDRILYEEVSPEVTPLSPENVIAFGCGPLTGTLFPGSGRTQITSISPETGLLGNSNMGGYWAPELKYAGYDHLVIKGKAEKPVYIFIDNDQVEIRDASSLWGKDTYNAQEILRKELDDPEVQILCIGRAGERLINYASIQHFLGDAAGRNGMGAVMGSKNLKAVVVRGTRTLKIGKPEEFLEIVLKAHELLKKSSLYEEYTKHSSGHGQDIAGKGDLFSVANFQAFTMERIFSV